MLAQAGMKRLLLDHIAKKSFFLIYYLKDKTVSYALAQCQHWRSKPNVGFGQLYNERKEHLCLYFLIALDTGKAKLRN